MQNDEDDLEQWLSGQAAQANLTPAAPQPTPAADGGGPWSKARDLMQRQSQMQYSAPERFSKPVEAEAAPEANEWKTILAMALNVLGNKGKDLGQIAMHGTEQRNHQLQQWRRDNSPRALADREMQMAQLRNADRQGFESDRRMLGDQIGQEMHLAGAQQGQANADRTFQAGRDDHDDQIAQNQLSRQVQEEQFGLSQGLTREQMAQAKALQLQQMGQSAAHFRAGQDFTREQNDLNRQHQTGLNNADNASLAERARLQAEARAQAAAARQPAVDARLTREYNKDTEYEQSLAQLLDSADKLAPEGKDIPGVGMFDGSFLGRTKDTVGAALGDSTSKQAERMAGIKSRLADLSQRMESGAAGPVSEELRYQIQVGAQPNATESEFRTAMKLAREHVQGKLKRSAAGRETQARSALDAGSLGAWLGNVQVPESQGFDPSVYGGVLDEDEEQ